jgi:hypothetical protein
MQRQYPQRLFARLGRAWRRRKRYRCSVSPTVDDCCVDRARACPVHDHERRREVQVTSYRQERQQGCRVHTHAWWHGVDGDAGNLLLNRHSALCKKIESAGETLSAALENVQQERFVFFYPLVTTR